MSDQNENTKTVIGFNPEEMGIIISTADSLKNLTNVNAIFNDGLNKAEWMILKSILGNTVEIVSLDNGSPVSTTPKSVIDKINNHLNGYPNKN